jgi:hypothetical protein
MQKTNKKKEKGKTKVLFPRSLVPSFPASSLSFSLSPPRGGRVCVFRHGCFRVQQLFPCSTAALQINRRRRRVSAAFFCSALCLQYKKDQRVEQQRFTFFDCKSFFFSAVVFLFWYLFWSLPIFPSFVCVVFLSSATTRIHLLFFFFSFVPFHHPTASSSLFLVLFVFGGLEKAHYCVLDGKVMYVGV